MSRCIYYSSLHFVRIARRRYPPPPPPTHPTRGPQAGVLLGARCTHASTVWRAVSAAFRSSVWVTSGFRYVQIRYPVLTDMVSVHKYSLTIKTDTYSHSTRTYFFIWCSSPACTLLTKLVLCYF
jgi:hypothetical protein